MRSFAVVFWRLFGKPEAFRKVVLVMPRFFAVLVISSAKLRSVPDTNSATAVAMSLADFVVSARIASCNIIESPALKPILEAGCCDALCEIGTIVASVNFPSSNPLNTT